MHPSSLYLIPWQLPMSLTMISFWINSEDGGGRHCIVLICLISLGSMPVKGDEGDNSCPWLLLCEVLQGLMLSYSYSASTQSWVICRLHLSDYISAYPTRSGMLEVMSVRELQLVGLHRWDFSAFVPILWNILPSKTRLAPSLSIFQKAHKIWLCHWVWSSSGLARY